MKPTRYEAVVKIGATDYSKQLESFSYTDEADGSSDSVSITLSDISGKWHNSKMPKAASKVIAKIKKTGEKTKTYACGIFHLDQIEFTGYPSSAIFSAVSDPVSYAFKTTQRNRTWKHTTFLQICKDISKTYKSLKVVYDAPTIPIAVLEQSKQTDSSLLKSLAEKYGCGVKIYANKIVVYSIERYENKKAVKTINVNQMEPGWTWQSTINGNYTGVKLTYKKTNGKKIETMHGSAKRLLRLTEKADSKADAVRIALARVNKENADTTTLRFTLRSPDFVSATSTINITGLAKLNGKYFVTRVRHTISNGYKVQIECRKIGKRIR